MKPHFLLILIVIALGLTGCGPAVYDSKQYYIFDGVKLIREGVTDAMDPSTFKQETYLLDARSRLLLRFETLSQYAKEVRTDGDRNVEVLITPQGSLADAKTSLRLCAVTRNWMMLSTWSRAHPFDASGIWSTPGGDFDPTACITTDRTEGDQLLFNVTPWFLDHVRGRDQNLGLILMSDRPITVYGETRSLESPRIRWIRTSTGGWNLENSSKDTPPPLSEGKLEGA